MIQPFIINTELESLNSDYRSKTLPTFLPLFDSAFSFSFFDLYANSSVALRCLNIITEPYIKQLFSRLLTNIQRLSHVYDLHNICIIQEIRNINMNIGLDNQLPPDRDIKIKDIPGLSLVEFIREDIISFINTYDTHKGREIIKQIQQLPFSINNPFSQPIKTILDKICKGNGTFSDTETAQLAEILRLVVTERANFDQTITRLEVMLRTTRTVNDYIYMKLKTMQIFNDKS
jgi:hypothetical protein